MKQHFLPKCYLNQFVDNNSMYALDYNLYKSRHNIEPRKKTPTQVCYGHDIYTLDANLQGEYQGLLNDNKYLIEKDVFKNYEDQYPQVIESVKRENYINRETAVFFLRFLVSLKLRNEFLKRSFFGEYTDKLVREILGGIRNEFLDGSNKLYPEIPMSKKSETIDSVQSRTIGNEDFKRSLWLSSILDRELKSDGLVQQIVEKWLYHKWVILKTNIQRPFLTTDNPGFCIDQDEGIHNTRFIDGAFMFQLTPYDCLFIVDNQIDVNFFDTDIKALHRNTADSTHVNMINKAAILNLNQYIFSPTKDSITDFLKQSH